MYPNSSRNIQQFTLQFHSSNRFPAEHNKSIYQSVRVKNCKDTWMKQKKMKWDQ